METERYSDHAMRNFGHRVNISGKLSSAQCLRTSDNNLQRRQHSKPIIVWIFRKCAFYFILQY